jgi:hypothetical protein
MEFDLIHSFALVEQGEGAAGPAVQTTAYSYQISDHNGPELLAWHWHPGKSGLPPFPHLHVTARTGTVAIERKHHVPTGFVSAPAVIRFVIKKLEVRPRRADWEQVLNEAERIVGRATAE